MAEKTTRASDQPETVAAPVVAPVVAPDGEPTATPAQEYIRDYVQGIEEHRIAARGPQAIRLGQAPGGPPAGAAPPVTPPPPAVFYSAPGTSGTLGEPRDIFASSVGIVTRAVTLRAASVTADANGDKLVIEGTTLAIVSGSNPQTYKPREDAEGAVGVLAERVNLRDSNKSVAMIVGGRLWRRRCIDDGTLGYPIAGGTPEDELNAIGVYFHDYQP